MLTECLSLVAHFVCVLDVTFDIVVKLLSLIRLLELWVQPPAAIELWLNSSHLNASRSFKSIHTNRGGRESAWGRERVNAKDDHNLFNSPRDPNSTCILFISAKAYNEKKWHLSQPFCFLSPSSIPFASLPPATSPGSSVHPDVRMRSS